MTREEPRPGPAAEEGVFHPEPIPRHRMPAGRALVVLLVALMAGWLLNAERIHRTAQTQPFGWKRTWAMRITGPIEGVSRATHLNWFRAELSDRAGNELPPPPLETASVVTAPPVDPAATTTTTTPIVLRTPTAADPLRILVIGDSLMGGYGQVLDRELDGRPVEIIEDWEVGTGLARPDVVNWPVRIADDMASKDPDVVVIGFGGNDAQGMSNDEGTIYQPGDAGWQAEYQRRVVQVLDAIEEPGRTVYWLGVPTTTRDNINEAAQSIEAAVTAEAAVRPWVHYVDPNEALAPDGEFLTYLDNERIRYDDGVHPTPEGVRLVLDLFLGDLLRERNVP